MKKKMLPLSLTALLLAPGIWVKFITEDATESTLANIWLGGMGISALMLVLSVMLLISLLYKGWSSSARGRVKSSLACCSLMSAFGLPFYYWLLQDLL